MSFWCIDPDDYARWVKWKDEEENKKIYVKEQLQDILDPGWYVSSVSFSSDGDVLAVISYPSLSDRYHAPSIFVKLSRSVFNLGS